MDTARPSNGTQESIPQRPQVVPAPQPEIESIPGPDERNSVNIPGLVLPGTERVERISRADVTLPSGRMIQVHFPESMTDEDLLLFIAEITRGLTESSRQAAARARLLAPATGPLPPPPGS